MIPRAASRRVRLWGVRLLVMTRKELLQLVRDIPLMIFLVYSFTLSAYITGSGVQTQLRNASLLVHDSDHSVSSRDLIYRFQPPYFRLDGETLNAREGMEALDQGRALAVLDIPPRFRERLLNGEQVGVQLFVDTTNSAQGLSAAGYATRIVAQFGREVALVRAGGADGPTARWPTIDSEHRVWYNPTMNDHWFESVSHILRMITLFAILLPAAALVREKEHGTVEQLLVSPLTPFQIMVPKVLAMTLVILMAAAVALFVILRPLFGVPVRGSALLLFLVMALFVCTMAGMGLLAATFTRNQAQVGMLTLLVVAPMLMLSGITTPMEAMPAWIRHLMVLSPLRYFIEVTHGILFKGTGLGLLWPQILSMAVLGAAVFGIGMWRFRRQFD